MCRGAGGLANRELAIFLDIAVIVKHFWDFQLHRITEHFLTGGGLCFHFLAGSRAVDGVASPPLEIEFMCSRDMATAVCFSLHPGAGQHLL